MTPRKSFAILLYGFLVFAYHCQAKESAQEVNSTLPIPSASQESENESDMNNNEVSPGTLGDTGDFKESQFLNNVDVEPEVELDTQPVDVSDNESDPVSNNTTLFPPPESMEENSELAAPESPSFTNYDEQIAELMTTNDGLNSRIEDLENRLKGMENILNSLSQDVHFYHPTMEVQYVDMQVVQWKQAVKSGLRNVAITFQAGFTIEALSSWEFSLASENEAVTVNLLLIEERYGKGALFAGFTAFVLDSEGNIFSQANALPVNFLDGNGRNLHLPNVIALHEITNSSNGILAEGEMFKIRFRLELLGVGHKLYPDNTLPSNQQISPAKDAQTAVFDVDNLFGKLAQKARSELDADPVAYTRFILRHDAWGIESEWSAELHTDRNGNSISLEVILDKCPWPELHASFNVEVWDVTRKRLIHTQGTPINNFVKDKITIDSLLFLSLLKQTYEEDEVFTVRFKLQFTVYGRNARYYSDV